MEKIKKFVLDFIQAEVEARIAQLNPDFETFNQKLANMDSFLSDELKTSFGMLYMTEPESEEFYDNVKYMDPIMARHLFIIKEVSNKKYGKLYLCYTSDVNDDKSYFHCLICKHDSQAIQITSRFTYGYGGDGSGKKHWYLSAGEKFKFEELKPVTDTLRILPPEDDEDSMKDYLTD